MSSYSIGVWGLIIVGGFVVYNAMQKSPEEQQKERAQTEQQRQEERTAQGNEACRRAAAPPPEARAPHDTGDAIDDLSSVVDGMTAKLNVSNIQHKLDEATLAGDTAQMHKLRGDLNDAKRAQEAQQAETDRRLAVARIHEAALQDIADCRKFRGED
ncbi:MAG: hypothetical protein ACLQJL_07585 [Roseiarcus sp.]